MRSAVLVVFVDAMGPVEADLLVRAGLGLPEVRSLEGVLGYSSGALPTILTGTPPSRHGRMCLFSRLAAGAVSPLAPLAWLGLLPVALHERGSVRRVAASAIAQMRGLSGYLALHRVPPSLFARLDIPETEDMFTARDVGGVPTFLARARDAGLRVVATDWHLPEAKRIEAIEAAPEADLAWLYLSGLDALLHRDGCVLDDERAWARRAVTWIHRAQLAMRAAHPGRDVQTLVVGDHGMAAVTAFVDPRSTVRAIERLAGREAFVFVDSTMLRVSPPERCAGEVRALLDQLPGTVLDGNALAARYAPGDGRYGDLIALLPEGSIFAPSYVGGRVRGMHGYDRDSASARAAVLASEALPAGMTRLEGVAPWVCGALGLASAG